MRTRLLLPVCLLALGCGLLDTDTPDIVDPGTLNNPQGAAARRIGAITDFALVRDGHGDGEDDGGILLTGLVADEFVHSTTPPSQQDFDQRRADENNPGVSDLYLNLHRARVAAENAAAALQQFGTDPDNDPGIAEMFNLAGYIYIGLAEDFCSGVPLSRVDGDALIFGDPVPRGALLDTALVRFDAALAHPGVAADPNMGFLAQVGRGRALLDQGRFAEAVLAVEGIPLDFQYVTEHAEAPLRLQNAIWSYSDGGLWSVADAEGGNGLEFLTAEDPRVPYFDTEDTGLDGATPQFTLLKYDGADASVVVADGIEAELIRAEGDLQGNDVGAMTDRLNDLRANSGLELEPLDQPADQDEAVTLLFSERAFWLFATGHRLGDLRRLVRQYGRDVDAVFPIGDYSKGGIYEEAVNLPVPVQERNNPKFSGCLDRDA